jgi:hypothetical protein
MYEIKYEKFFASVCKDGVKLRGFSCYLTQHAWDLAEKFLLDELKLKHEKTCT